MKVPDWVNWAALVVTVLSLPDVLTFWLGIPGAEGRALLFALGTIVLLNLLAHHVAAWVRRRLNR